MNNHLSKLKNEYLYPERIMYQQNLKRTYKYYPLNETKKTGASFIKLEELLKKKNLKLIPNNDIKQLIINFSKEKNFPKQRRNSSDILTTSTIDNNNKLPKIKSSKEFFGLNILSNNNSNSNITKRNNEKTILTKIEKKKQNISSRQKKDMLFKSSSQDNIFDTHKISHTKKHKINISLKIKGTFIRSIVGQNNISKIGKEKENIKKINQDLAFSKLNFFSKSLGLISLIGIIDGHGSHGHIISKTVKNFFCDYFENNINMTLSLNKDNYYTILTESFIRCEEYLIQNNIDLNLNLNQSGCTCIILFFSNNFTNKNKVFCANCGNCKCILYSNTNYVPLSYSHSPNRVSEIMRMKEIVNNIEKIKIEKIKNIEEKKNENDNNNEILNSNKEDLILTKSIIDKKNSLILQNSQSTIKNIIKPKGKVFQDLNLLKKIFIKEFKELNLSRSIGDLDAKEIGIISEPEIVECDLKVQKAKILVMGTSSLFEYLSIEEIGIIVKKYYKDNNGFDACVELEELAKERWKQNVKKVEDITVIVIFLDFKG